MKFDAKILAFADPRYHIPYKYVSVTVFRWNEKQNKQLILTFIVFFFVFYLFVSK